MKTNDISHEGTIISIEKENLRVRIIQNSACASCKIAGHCQTSESKEKIIEVTTPDYADFAVGDKVNVTESVGVGAKAVVFGFILPLALMMAAIISAITAFDASEGVAVTVKQRLVKSICHFFIEIPSHTQGKADHFFKIEIFSSRSIAFSRVSSRTANCSRAR